MSNLSSLVTLKNRVLPQIKLQAKKRAELKAIIKNPSLSTKERMNAASKLHKMPVNGSITRWQNRCIKTGTSHSVFRKYNLSAFAIRDMAYNGYLPGIKKK